MNVRLARIAATLLLGLGLVQTASAQAGGNWQMAKGPLVTQWAKDVSPANALVEYPRPQFVRADWVNLNGLWDYAITEKEAVSVPAQYDGKILVPYPIESALSGVMKGVDANQRLWYRRTFQAPKLPDGGRLLLHFGAVDWEAIVSVNGKQVVTHRGGYDGFSADITDALKPTAQQELIVSVYDATNAKGSYQQRGKQNFNAIKNPGGIMYTPTTGIWQTVWLEPVPAVRLASLKITPDLDNAAVKVGLEFQGITGGKIAGKVEILDGKTVIQTGGFSVAGFDNKTAAILTAPTLSLPVPNAKTWSPHSPFLYGLRITMLVNDKPADLVESYFGMRKIEVKKDDKGFNRILLNNKFVFQVGPLDQGFWPDGIYTAPTDAALKSDIEITKKLGFNMARKHVKVEPDRWYYWCDKLGLLVWQDMPSGDPGPRPADAPPSPKATTKGAKAPRESEHPRMPESAKQYETELKALIDGRYNHPCIIMWVVFNEGWGQFDTVRLTNWVRQYDPSRLADPASGWTDFPAGSVIDMHNYPGPGCPAPQEDRASVLGEFGGLGLAIEGHLWTEKHWGYRGMNSPKELTNRYIALLRKAYELKDANGLNACVYTQTTDCETECNGLLTYDRAVVKPDLDAVASANRGTFPPIPELKEVVATSRKDGVTWQYTTDKPADGWFKADFDASSWKQGPGGFGTEKTPGAIVRTTWKTPDIYLRREFTLPADVKPENLLLIMHHDDDAEVYINGAEAVKVTGFIRDYEQFDISPAAKAAIKAGKNILAVHCHQFTGGQYIDVGLGHEVMPEKK